MIDGREQRDIQCGWEDNRVERCDFEVREGAEVVDIGIE